MLDEIAKIKLMERGSITEVSGRGGYKFHSHSVYENGKSKGRHVTKAGVDELNQLIAEHEKFQALVKEYEDLVVQETRRYYEDKYPKKKRGPLAADLLRQLEG